LTSLILTIHIIACILLIIIVLLQPGKEGMGVIFGGSSQSMFGGAGAGGLLTKVTATLAALFLVTSLAYSYFSGTEVAGDETIFSGPYQEEQAEPEPARPAVTFEDEEQPSQSSGSNDRSE
jgi:preprotein translocase subunit SecG